MIKEQDCTNYEPGPIQERDYQGLCNLLSRTANGDNQRRTQFYYLYSKDNLLMGK